MDIDFFISSCTNTLSDEKFGLCDDIPPPSNIPAFTDTSNPEKWIATVNRTL